MEKKILIVDDEPDFLFILNNVLKRAGYNVISAKSGRECLKKVVKEKPDLIFLDIMMNDIDGWEVCKKIKKDSPHIPVSMCSILQSSYEIDRSFNYAGADEHLKKPINFKEVLHTAQTLQPENAPAI